MADEANTNVTPISAESRLSDEAKREQLRAKIEAGEQRNQARSFAEQAKDAADSAVEFTKKHPFAVIGGAIVAGLAIGAMTKPGRRAAKRGGALAALASEAALAFGVSMIDRLGDGADYAGDRFGDLRDSAGKTARTLGKEASYKLDGLSDTLRGSGRKGSRAYRSLRDRLTH